MKFGTEITPVPFTAPGPDVWRATYERCELLEELGFHFGTIGQHRFQEGWPTAPWNVLAAVSARTSKLRLGTGILLLPLEHPLTVAEHVATVDEISNGRAFLGVGLGYRKYEFNALQVPYKTRGARMDESLEIIRAAWTQETVAFDGRHYQFDDVEVFPKPVQRPHPPIWVAASLWPGFERAARHGDAYYGGTIDSLPHLVPYLDRYRALAAEEGRPSSVCLKRPLCIGSREMLEKSWLPGATSFRHQLATHGGQWLDDDDFLEKIRSGGPVGVSDFVPNRAILGTPDECITQIEHIRRVTGCEHLQVSLNELRGRPDMHEQQLRLFAEEVMPAFAE